MEFQIKYPGFEGQNLTVKSEGPYNSKLFLNSKPLTKENQIYKIKDNVGTEVLVQLKSNLLDPVPNLTINKIPFLLADPLKWYEYIWLGLPFLLVVTGGAVGGAFGSLAAHTNAVIFRGKRGTFTKYALSALVSTSSFIAFAVTVTALRVMIKHS